MMEDDLFYNDLYDLDQETYDDIMDLRRSYYHSLGL